MIISSKHHSYISNAVQLLQVILGLIFLASSIPKIALPFEFLSAIYDYQLLGRDMGLLLAIFLPYIEASLGVLLLINFFPLETLILVVFCCCAFVVAQVWVIYQGLEIACACFGSSANHISYSTIGRTCGLLMAALLLIGYYVFFLKRNAVAHCCDCLQEK